MTRIYLDHNATTPVRPEALEAMLPFLTEKHGNASSQHAFGREARDAVESARDRVAQAINAEPSEIVFVSGGTEADNLALRGVMTAARRPGKKHLIVSAIEHHAVLETAHALETEGHTVTVVGADGAALVSPEAVAHALREDTALASVMLANNETGTLEPVGRIASRVGEAGAQMHTDAVQAVGKVPVDVRELGVDLLSLSAHKFGGPKGVGALYVRQGTVLPAIQHGGAHERGRRPGTENVAGIVGLAAALEAAVAQMPSQAASLRGLTSGLVSSLRERVAGLHINTPERSVPGTVNASFEDVDGEALIVGLDLDGICVSSGSACASGSMEPSHVLSAMGVPADLARGTVRFSFGVGNTDDDVKRTADVVETLVTRMRKRASAGPPPSGRDT